LTLFKTDHRVDLLRRDLYSDDKAFATPKLYTVIGDKALGLRDCLSIVGANQRLKSNEVPVVPNDVSARYSATPGSPLAANILTPFKGRAFLI
jgi:hypothetical protein